MADTSGGSDDRIDIEVNDKIASTIPVKLKQIADSADRGATSVQRLKAQLASIADTPTARLRASVDGVTNSLNRELDAQKTLASTANTTTAALDKEAQAQDRISKMVDASIAKYQLQRKAAQDAYAAAVQRSRGAGLAGAAEGAGIASTSATVAEAAAIGAGVSSAAKETEVAVTELEATAAGPLARFKTAALGAFDTVRDAVMFNAGKFKGFLGSGGVQQAEKEASAISKVGHAAATNSIAIRELFVLGREGARGDFTRMAGSVSILASSLGLLHTVLIPLTLVLGLAAAGMKIFEESVRSDIDPQLKAYANTLGLTEKEMRKLHNTTLDAKGKLKELDLTSLTFGDVFKGAVKTAKEEVAGFGQDAKEKFGELGISWSGLWDGAKKIMYYAFLGFYATVRTFVDFAVATIGNCLKIVGNVGVAIASVVAEAIVGIVNSGISSLNFLADKANGLIGHKLFGQMEKWKADAPKYFSLSHIDLGSDFDGYVRDGQQKLSRFYTEWKQNSAAAARQRITDEANAIKGQRNPKKHHDPKTKDDFLDDENKKLDDQIRRMTILKDARETQQQLDEIEEAFQKRRMPLNEAEIAQFRKKLETISAYKYVQQELDRIYEEAISPQRTYNATIAAASDLLKRGAIDVARYALEVELATTKLAATNDLIGANEALRQYQDTQAKAAFSVAHGGVTQQQANEAVARARREYQQAIDPLFQMNEAVDAGMKAARAYGIEVERANYLESIRQAYAAKGKSITDANTGALTAEVQALVKKNDELRQQQFLQTTVGSIVNPMLEYNRTIAAKQALYAELNRLGDQYNLTEKQRAQARMALDLKFNELRLAGAEQFFGELAGLSSSSNKRIAALGKAAAVAQATIDGYLAVQKALSAPPGPPWSFAIAAATAIKTGANVAAILSTNVGSFDNGGDFIVQGRSGVDQNAISMNLSRGERVKIETPYQQRQADKGHGGDVHVPIKVVNIHDPSEIPAAMEGEDGERVILNVLRRNPRAIAAIVKAAP